MTSANARTVKAARISTTFYYVPLWLGMERGMFADRNITIELEQIGDGAVATNRLRSGDLDVSLAPPDGAAGTYLYESTTVVTQRAFDDEGDTVVRVQRRRATRSSEAPQTRVQTDTVVRRTARGDDGTLVKTTTRDRAVNPTFDAEPRPATSAEMSALLRPKGALPPATGTPSSAATPTPDVDNPP